MFSTLDKRRIIERSFAPLACTCTLEPGPTFKIRIFNPASGSVELIVTGICVVRLDNADAIARLIGELRYEMAIVAKR